MPAFASGKPRVVLTVRGAGSWAWDPVRMEVRFLDSPRTLRSFATADVVATLPENRNCFVDAARAAARDVLRRLPPVPADRPLSTGGGS